MTGTPLIDRLPNPGAGFVWGTVDGDAIVLRPETDLVDAVFTTRVGGASEGPFASWNMSYAVGDERKHVAANRAIANEAVERPGTSSWGRIRQVHGNVVVRARPASADLLPADAVWSDDRDDVIAVFAADCLPVLLVGSDRVAAAHAGWRGLIAGVVEAAASAVGATTAWVGPGIGPCCFEIGADAADPLRGRFGPTVLTDETHADLWTAAEIAARAGGVLQLNTARVCVSCSAELFFSHRRDRGRTGRQALVAAPR